MLYDDDFVLSHFPECSESLRNEIKLKLNSIPDMFGISNMSDENINDMSSNFIEYLKAFIDKYPIEYADSQIDRDLSGLKEGQESIILRHSAIDLETGEIPSKEHEYVNTAYCYWLNKHIKSFH